MVDGIEEALDESVELAEDDFGFDDDEDEDFMERSQRKLLKERRTRVPRMRNDW